MTGNISLMKTICFWSQEKGRRVAIFILFVCFSNEPAEGLFLQRRFHQLYSLLCLPLSGTDVWVSLTADVREPRGSIVTFALAVTSSSFVTRSKTQRLVQRLPLTRPPASPSYHRLSGILWEMVEKTSRRWKFFTFLWDVCEGSRGESDSLCGLGRTQKILLRFGSSELTYCTSLTYANTEVT